MLRDDEVRISVRRDRRKVGDAKHLPVTGDVSDGEVVALIKDGARVTEVGEGEAVTILTNQTPFYGESGGQMGDAGRITGGNGLSVLVEDTSKPLGRLHAPVIRPASPIWPPLSP